VENGVIDKKTYRVNRFHAILLWWYCVLPIERRRPSDFFFWWRLLSPVVKYCKPHSK